MRNNKSLFQAIGNAEEEKVFNIYEAYFMYQNSVRLSHIWHFILTKPYEIDIINISNL